MYFSITFPKTDEEHIMSFLAGCRTGVGDTCLSPSLSLLGPSPVLVYAILECSFLNVMIPPSWVGGEMCRYKPLIYTVQR